MLHIKSNLLRQASFDYSSTQINLPLDMTRRIIEWGDESILDTDIYHEDGERGYGREEDIHCTIKYGLPNSDEHPIYKPHITIAYIKTATNHGLSGKKPFDGIKIPVNEIIFSPKTGNKVAIPLK